MNIDEAVWDWIYVAGPLWVACILALAGRWCYRKYARKKIIRARLHGK